MSQKLYDIAARFQSGNLQTEAGYLPVFGLIVPMAAMYFVTTSTGLSRMEGCDAVKSDTQMRKYFEIALTVGTTIPVVLIMQKFIQKDLAFYMMLYGLAGAVTAGMMTDVFKKCESNETEKKYNGFYLTGFAVVFLMGLLAFLFIR